MQRASRGSGTVPRTPPAAPAAAAGRRHRSDVSLESGPDGGQSPSPPPPPPGDGPPPPPPPEGAAQLQLGSDQVQFPVTAVGRRSSGSLRFSNSSGVDLHWSLEPLVKPWVQVRRRSRRLRVTARCREAHDSGYFSYQSCAIWLA